jgi:acyl-coenzyme A thioesterase PaaI-like protein
MLAGRIERGGVEMTDTAIQDLYPQDVAHCYGCGRLNDEGLHVRTHWQDGEGVAHYTPRSYHIAIPGYVYGGLLASLVDCHAIGTAAAAAMAGTEQVPGVDPSPRFVTASLKVDFLKPTPLGPQLELRARPEEIGERRVTVAVDVFAGGDRVVHGEVVAVRMPEAFTSRP